jgi:coenzyme F420-dependent oxidoreductase
MARIGLTLPRTEDLPRKDIVEVVQQAETLGYDSVWVGESWGRDGFSWLTQLACHTSRIKLATGIATVYSRSPALIAQTVASLDELSDGRVILGLGTSGPIVIENWHGIKYEKPLRRTREAVEILRLALAGERVDYDGEVFKLKGFRLLMRPVQRRMPVYLATFKPAAVKQTGAIADGWLPTHVSVRHFDALRADLDEGAKLAGRTPDELDVAALLLVACSADGETARALCREHLAYYVGGMGTFYHELMHQYGYGDVGDRIKAAWKKGDRAGASAAIPRDVLDDLVVAGTQEECRAAIEVRRKAGFRHIVAFPPHSSEPEQVLETLKAVAPSG